LLYLLALNLFKVGLHKATCYTYCNLLIFGVAFMSNKQNGFTLLEIMVVVIILGILAAIIVPRIADRPDQARMVKAKQDILAIQDALDLYKLDNGFLPTNEQGLQALVTKPTTAPIPGGYKDEGYLPRVPMDPWGRPYRYINPGSHNVNGVDIFSYGPVGQANSQGVIGNW
jgi:general secretion pathway protein G